MQKHIKKLPQGRLILPTPTALLFSETLNLTSDIKYNRGIKSEFNKTLWYGPTSFQHFQGALSKDFFHDINFTLEAQNIEAATIHTGINYIKYESSSQQISLLLQDIDEMLKKCKSYGIKYIFISSVILNTIIPHKLLNEINEMIEVC